MTPTHAYYSTALRALAAVSAFVLIDGTFHHQQTLPVMRWFRGADCPKDLHQNKQNPEILR
jgi:hypothetical protein